MTNPDNLLSLAENLIYNQTNKSCSDLQRSILSATLRRERKTYEQLAAQYGYSPKYLRQDVAPKLWHLLSEVLGQKVTRANLHGILSRQIQPNNYLSASKVENLASRLVDIPTHTNSGAPSNSKKSGLPQASILLVDDEPKNLRLLSEILEEQGYEVRQATNGELALQAITLAPPDLILLDICMPELDGYSVCQQLKANPNTLEIPVIFVSALDQAWDQVKAFSVGCTDYINKPFKVVEVLARVENHLKILQLQKELKERNAQLQQAIEELLRLAAVDSLTLVSSRNRFDEYLLFNWHQSSKAKTLLTLMLCEIDDHLGDNNMGSPINNQCLFQVAQIIKKTVQRPEDLIARYQEITFGIILPNLDVEKSKQIAQTLLEEVQKVQNPTLNPTTLSIGVATILPKDTIQLDSLIKSCVSALEEAKIKGGNQIIQVNYVH